MRLINADDFKKFLNKLIELGAPYEDVVKLLDNQPTAFDVDKVVKKLKHSQCMLLRELKHATSYSHEEELIENIKHYEYAINIVKAGGIDE